jgi:hypothetical protein
MLDPSFLEAVKSLLNPWTDTEVMAPLLYTLTRFTRARTVLEAGSGYTTPFLAKALADNAHAVEEERRAMLEKTARYIADLDAMQDTPASVQPGTKVAPGLVALFSPTSPVTKNGGSNGSAKLQDSRDRPSSNGATHQNSFPSTTSRAREVPRRRRNWLSRVSD